MSFVHLHVRSQFSLLQATCRFKDIIEIASTEGMPAVANTDDGNMFGAVEFYLAAQARNIKPILGLGAYLAPESRWNKTSRGSRRAPTHRRLVLLAQNLQGYRHLCQLSSIGYKEGFYYKPRIDYEVLEKFSKDIICLSGGIMGEVPWTFQNEGADKALEKVQNLKQIFKDRLYLEINRTGGTVWDDINPFLQEVSQSESVPLVATNDVHYTHPEDQVAQEVLVCIGSNKILQDDSRMTLGSNQFYFKTVEQMRELFKDIPEACDNTLEIAERCNFHFQLKDSQGQPIYYLPSFPTTKTKSLSEELQQRASQGLESRFVEAKHRGEEITDPAPYWERLKYELGVIEKMGFNGYFLIVCDFIGWAKAHGIPVGPGRGSGAGSLVAYSLGITDLDPLPYRLIFERFLNPERISMPDFDIDFCQEKRSQVIEYVTKKYGESSVSQIITYGRLQTRAAIRDVGRVLGMTFSEVDVISKLVPDRLGITLQESIDEEPRFKELMEADPKIQTLIELALKIEGLVRHAGIHAAGVVIADGNIVDHAPLYRGADGENVVQYDMKHAEKIGLIKFDFLGLKTLTHIHEAIDLIEKNRGVKIKTSDISLKDKGIYKIMGRGETAGIFQFEGEGITNLIVKAQPHGFEDIVAINALYRPGPMDMIPDYLDRKHGRKKVKYLFPELEEITKETYGIIIYQEQVQLIASRIASYSLGEADLLRRAMGKKIASEMAQQKTRFLQGAKENGYNLKKSEKLFDTMAEFAKYGFNKSHAAAYCVIAAQTAYLKNYYPVEFFAALLSTEINDTDKVIKYVKTARKHNIVVKPPHINHSGYKFSVEDHQIFFSLGAIKGVGEFAVEAIVEARKQLPENKFPTLESFFHQAEVRKVNKKTIECLIKAGAMDGFDVHRADLIKNYAKFIERSGQHHSDHEVGQVSLFSMSEETYQQEEKVLIKKGHPWTQTVSLSYEKEVLGFYLSNHPLSGFKHLVKKWITCEIGALPQAKHQSHVHAIGIISSLRQIITKKGTRMAFGQLEDMSGTVELVIFPDIFSSHEMDLQSEGPLLVSGVLEREKTQCKILVDKVEILNHALGRSKKIWIDMSSKFSRISTLEKLKDILTKHPGPTPLTLRIQLSEWDQIVQLNIQEPQGVTVSAELCENIHQILGSPKAIHLQ